MTNYSMCIQYTSIYTKGQIIGNFILIWPKLLGPFQNYFPTYFRCVCVRYVILHDFLYK